MKTMKVDWDHVAYAAYGTAVLTAAIMFTSTSLTATACKVGGNILPADIHQSACHVSDLDTNGMALRR